MSCSGLFLFLLEIVALTHLFDLWDNFQNERDRRRTSNEGSILSIHKTESLKFESNQFVYFNLNLLLNILTFFHL